MNCQLSFYPLYVKKLPVEGEEKKASIYREEKANVEERTFLNFDYVAGFVFQDSHKISHSTCPSYNMTWTLLPLRIRITFP